ncbi:MAG: gluconokinase [Actinomycetales bacterium]
MAESSAPAGGTLHVVVMGVSGSGKSTVAEGIAAECDLAFGEADLFHPQSNIDKMSAGIALTDEDRWPWLRDLSAWMAERAKAGTSTVMASSALRKVYRDLLRSQPEAVGGRVFFIHLAGPLQVIHDRMAARGGHFMPVSLLRSQFDTLEPLEPGEPGIELDLQHSPQELIGQSVAVVRDLMG